MSDIVSINPNRPADRDGLTVPGALAYFYLSGTTTPQVVYTTGELDIEHPVPLAANAEGVFPPIYSALALRAVVTDASGQTLPGFPVDPVATIPTGAGAESISFEPTGDIPATNVQDAIERVQANLVAPLLAGGIGVTGNADTIANIDATGTASGAYRFTTGATGTFPSGIGATDGGTIRLWRDSAAEAVMELSARGSSVSWQRSLTAGAWGAWARGGVGFTPVEQGGGAGMNADKVRIGSNGSGSLIAAINSTALGAIHTSNLSAGALGTYCFARRTGGDVGFGVTVPGSQLATASAVYRIESSGGGSPNLATGGSLSGTWRCMGNFDSTVSSGQIQLDGVTLWMRTA